MQQTKSCVNSMLQDTGPSRVHSGCSLHGHRLWEGCILLPVCTTCPGSVGAGHTTSKEPKVTSCFGVLRCRDGGPSPRWQGDTGLGRPQKMEASQGAATLQP